MSYIEYMNEFRFNFRRRKDLQKFVKEIKQEFPNIDIKVGSFKEGNKCKVLKNIYAISVIQKINDIAKKYE